MERWKEPPSRSEIEHETISSQVVGGESDLWLCAYWRMKYHFQGLTFDYLTFDPKGVHHYGFNYTSLSCVRKKEDLFWLAP
jgi:hypothetical protein